MQAWWQWPHLALMGEPRGFSRVSAGFSSYDVEFRLPIVWAEGLVWPKRHEGEESDGLGQPGWFHPKWFSARSDALWFLVEKDFFAVQSMAHGVTFPSDKQKRHTS